MSDPTSARVIVAIPEDRLRREVAERLREDPWIVVAGAAASLGGARRLLDEAHAGTLVTATSLPPLGEAGAVVLLHQARHVGLHTVVLAPDADPRLPRWLLADGADGWGWLVLGSHHVVGGFTAAVLRVHRGGTVIDDEIVRALAELDDGLAPA